MDYQELITRLHKAVEPLKHDPELWRQTFQRCLEHELGSNGVAQQPGRTKGAEPDEEAEKKVRQSGSRKTSSRKFTASTVREDVQNLNLRNVDGLKPHGEFKSKSGKCLWLLAFAHENGVDGLTFNEVAYLMTDKLKVALAAKHVGGAFRSAAESGLVYWDDIGEMAGVKIQAPGLEKCRR